MLRKNFRSLAITFALALVCAQVGVFAPAAQAQQPRAPLSFRTLDGGQVSSESWRGQVVVLAFGASWLPLCRAQAQGLQRLSEQYAGRGAQFFWVSTEADNQGARNFASAEQLRAFATRHNLQVTILRDPNGAISRQLGVDQIPAIVLLDKQGNVSGTPIGGGNTDPDSDLATQLGPKLDRLLN